MQQMVGNIIESYMHCALLHKKNENCNPGKKFRKKFYQTKGDPENPVGLTWFQQQ